MGLKVRFNSLELTKDWFSVGKISYRFTITTVLESLTCHRSGHILRILESLSCNALINLQVILVLCLCMVETLPGKGQTKLISQEMNASEMPQSSFPTCLAGSQTL